MRLRDLLLELLCLLAALLADALLGLGQALLRVLVLLLQGGQLLLLLLAVLAEALRLLADGGVLSLQVLAGGGPRRSCCRCSARRPGG
ncbi:MAG: hypothetical protein LC623_00905 [Halobacteriales archaeon]|nr:hypothetical protein [Halobacteriales archaeon]